MTRKLGALLVGEGLITNDQLEEALRIQSLYGGRIGSNLVEMGYLDVDVLADRLAHVTGFQCATTAMLEESPYDTSRLISADLAEKFESIPFRREGRRLFVAMVNPTDLAASDELRFKTSLQIVPHVAPEILIRTFLEKRYGVKSAVKAIQIQSKKQAGPTIPAGIRREAPPAAAAPPPPPSPPSRPPIVPGPPPRAGEPVRPPGTPLAAIPLTSPSWGGKQPTPAPSATVVAEPRVTTNPGPSAYRSRLANGADLPVEPPTIPPAPVSRPPADTWPPRAAAPTTIPPGTPVAQPPPEVTAAPGSRPSLTARMSFAQVDVALAEAIDRDDLAETMLRFAAGRTDAAVILLVRDGQVVGWKGRGAGLNESQVEALQLPLAESPILVEAIEQRQPVGGAPVDGRLSAAFYETLQLRRPESAFVVPVVLRNRAVNLIYGDRTSRPDALDAADPFLELADQVSAAYERIFRESRRKR